MKTITSSAFIKLLASAAIEVDSDLTEVVDGYSDEYMVPRVAYGYIWNTLVMDGFTLSYNESYEHPECKTSHVTTSNDIPEVWTITTQEFEVVDDDDDDEVLDDDEIFDLVEKHTDIRSFDFSILGEDEVEELEGIDPESIFWLDNFTGPDVKFSGKLTAHVCTSPEQNDPDFSGTVGVWSVYAVYTTTRGETVAERMEGTQWDGDETRTYTKVYQSTDELVAFIGDNKLARKLYRRMGVNVSAHFS